jgi:hypothetical protein
MHISLDSALGRQRRLNSVGESVFQIAPDAAAGYSLRSLTGGDPAVVRVRRESDNNERDFNASGVSSGELVNWVNEQITPPLDLRELTATGRDGPIIEAAAAYSLRNLSDSYTGSVVDVRRSSDGNTESFTAAEVADGTLTTWVGAGNDGTVSKWYDQSTTSGVPNANHAVQTDAASQPKIVSGGSLLLKGANSEPSISFGTTADKHLDVTGRPVTKSVFSTLQSGDTNFETLICDTGDSSPRITTNNAANNRAYKFLGFGTPSVNVNGVTYDGTSSVFSFGFHLLGMTSGTGSEINRIGANSSTGATGDSFDSVSELILYPDDQSDNRTALEANIGEVYGIAGIPAYEDTVNGFVETWYDQSGNGNDASQLTAGNQPKIVDAGALVTGGLDFDGVGDQLDLSGSGLDIFKNVGYAQAFTVATSENTGTSIGAIFRLNNNSTVTRFSLGDSPTTNSSTRVGGRRLDSDSFDSTTANTTHGTTQKLFTGFLNYVDAEAYIYQNGVNVGTDLDFKTAGNSSNTTSSAGGIGYSNFVGRVLEVIVYNTDQSANREAIEANINNQYDIY